MQHDDDKVKIDNLLRLSASIPWDVSGSLNFDSPYKQAIQDFLTQEFLTGAKAFDKDVRKLPDGHRPKSLGETCHTVEDMLKVFKRSFGPGR